MNDFQMNFKEYIELDERLRDELLGFARGGKTLGKQLGRGSWNTLKGVGKTGLGGLDALQGLARSTVSGDLDPARRGARLGWSGIQDVGRGLGQLATSPFAGLGDIRRGARASLAHAGEGTPGFKAAWWDNPVGGKYGEFFGTHDEFIPLKQLQQQWMDAKGKPKEQKIRKVLDKKIKQQHPKFHARMLELKARRQMARAV